MGVEEAEARKVINTEADDTIAKMKQMNATPEEMVIASKLAEKVNQLISVTADLARHAMAINPVRVHQLTLYIALRAEQAVTKSFGGN